MNARRLLQYSPDQLVTVHGIAKALFERLYPDDPEHCFILAMRSVDNMTTETREEK